jgi:glycosyltransferase involved in cell wall biosynthesis
MKDKTRVGIVVSKIHPNVGGGYTFTNNLVESLLSFSDQKTEISFFVTDRSHKKIIGKSFEKKVIYVGKSRIIRRFTLSLERLFPSLAFWMVQFAKLEKKVKKEQIDFLFFLGATPVFSTCPYGIIIWDLQHRTHPWFPELQKNGEWFKRERILASILPRASLIITGTEVGKSQIKNFYGVQDERISIIKHPTPKMDVRELEVLRRLDEDRIKFFYPAQFWAHKNHIVIIEAVKKINSLNKYNFEVLFSGSDKGNLKYIKSQAKKLGVEDNIKFLGFVSQNELNSIYKNIDALIYPSVSGPENLPPLEALACGKPVFYSDFPGAKEQLQDSVFYFDPQDADELSKLLIEFMQGKLEFEVMVKKGKKLSMERSVEGFLTKLVSDINNFSKIRNLWEK